MIIIIKYLQLTFISFFLKIFFFSFLGPNFHFILHWFILFINFFLYSFILYLIYINTLQFISSLTFFIKITSTLYFISPCFLYKLAWVSRDYSHHTLLAIIPISVSVISKLDIAAISIIICVNCFEILWNQVYVTICINSLKHNVVNLVPPPKID